ncbi:hypothetical protein D9M68_88620 [compost metagenome]
MRLARALELTRNITSTPNSIEGLDSLLDPSLVEQALEQASVAVLSFPLCQRQVIVGTLLSFNHSPERHWF